MKPETVILTVVADADNTSVMADADNTSVMADVDNISVMADVDNISVMTTVTQASEIYDTSDNAFDPGSTWAVTLE